MKNTNIKIATLLALTAMTSCQKDYYLEDLEAANKEIESLKSQVSDLIAQGNADSAEITMLNQAISTLEGNIAQLTSDLEAQNLLTQDIEADLAEANDKLANANTEINDLNAQIQKLNDDLSSQEVTSAQYLEIIAELEADLAYEKANVKVVTEYITEVITETEVVTEVQVVEIAATPVIETPAEIVVENNVNSNVVTPVAEFEVEEIEVKADGFYYGEQSFISMSGFNGLIGDLPKEDTTFTAQQVVNGVATDFTITVTYDYDIKTDLESDEDIDWNEDEDMLDLINYDDSELVFTSTIAELGTFNRDVAANDGDYFEVAQDNAPVVVEEEDTPVVEVEAAVYNVSTDIFNNVNTFSIEEGELLTTGSYTQKDNNNIAFRPGDALNATIKVNGEPSLPVAFNWDGTETVTQNGITLTLNVNPAYPNHAHAVVTGIINDDTTVEVWIVKQ